MKVIGIGQGRTGTTSLGRALEILGFREHCSWEWQKVFDYFDGKTDELVTFAADFNNVEDWPWALLYKEIYRYYDNLGMADEVKFILTTRKSPEIWYKSQCRMYDANCLDEFAANVQGRINQAYYDSDNPYHDSDKWIEKYLSHNREVRAFFKDKPNFLEVCWETGDGWRELCQFLGKEIPITPFPSLNKSASKIYLYKRKFKKAIKRVIKKYL